MAKLLKSYLNQQELTLSLLKSTGTDTNLSTSCLSTLLIELLKSVGKFFNLSISNLSTLDFKLAISTLNYGVSTPFAFLNLPLLHN